MPVRIGAKTCPARRTGYKKHAATGVAACSGMACTAVGLFLAGGGGVTLFLFDAGFFAGEVAQVVDTGTTNDTHLVYLDAVDVRRVEREDAFYADAVRNFADGEHLGDAAALDLDYDTAEALHALLVTLDDTVGYGDRVAAFERGHLFLGPHRILCDFDQIVHCVVTLTFMRGILRTPVFS